MSDFFKENLQRLKDQGLYRFLKTVESDQGPEITFEGKKYLNFSSNNYLGLANHPALIQAAIEATQKYGTGSGASRLITGSMSLHQELEEKIAKFKGVEAALLFNSGYHANIGIIPTVVGERDAVFSDELNHASLIDGCRLSKAKTLVYRHNDMEHLEELLVSASYVKKLIITDSVFSMDGDLAPLPQIINLAEKYDALVLVDEAHATGVFGKTGRGVVEHFGISSDHPRLIQMGTLGKALGSFGAYVCGARSFVDYLINRARSFIFTTALSPGVAASALAAVNLISENLSYKDQLWKNVNYFGEKLGNKFFSPIFPLIIGDSKKTMEASEKLFQTGIWAQGIRPPTVNEGTSRLRLTLMATHTREHLDRCLEALHSCL